MSEVHMDIPLAGRLTYFCSQWLQITNNTTILSWVAGYKIPFIKEPIQSLIPKKCNKLLSRADTKIIDNCVNELIQSGFITYCKPCHGQFISPIFTVLKPNGKHRFILNLKSLNKYVHVDHFKMEDHRTAVKLLNTNYYMSSIDLKDSYFFISIDEQYKKYLRFQWNDSLLQFEVLPFGLCTAPFVFTKLMRPVIKYLRSQGFLSVSYLDDFLLIGSTKAECLLNVVATKNLLEKLGFVLNLEKSQLTPNKKCKFLGFVFDTEQMTLNLPIEKKVKIKKKVMEFLQKKTCTIRQFAEFLGLLTSACPAVRYGWVHTKLFEREKFLALKTNLDNYDKRMYLPKYIKPDLLWWRDHIDSAYAPFCSNNYSMEIFSDASLTGWGASCGSEVANGHWKASESSLHINKLELIAAFYSLKIFGYNSKNCNILMRIDNTTAIAYINRMGGVQFPHLNQIAREIWEWCENRNIFIFASYIKSIDNKVADRASREINWDNEWELSQDSFSSIINTFGNPEFDLFASSHNNKCDRYASWKLDPNSEIIDAFTFNWNNLKFYAFPPFCLISRVLQKIMNDEAEGIVIVPNWPSQPWYPLWHKLRVSKELFFGPSSHLLKSPFRKIHPLQDDLILVAARLSYKRC